MKIRRYMLMWLPKSGLFYDGGDFFDGQGNALNWDRTIPTYSTPQRADTSKKRIVEAHPDRKGEIVMFGVEFEEIE